MKYILIIGLLFCITVQKPYIYLTKFDSEKQAKEVMQHIDTTYNVDIVYNIKTISHYEHNGEDSTAIYYDGYFVDAISYEYIKELEKYIVDPYPKSPSHSFYGWDENNAIYIRHDKN